MSAILFEPKTPWTKYEHKDCVVYKAGHFSNLDEIIQAVAKNDIALLEKLLLGEKLQYGLMIAANDTIFAATDRTLSFPIFYHSQTNRISNHAQYLDAKLKENIDKDALLSFTASGYTLGNTTLHKDIRIFEAGTYALFKTSDPVKTKRYYIYAPKPTPQTPQTAQNNFGKAIDRAIADCISCANGAPIWIPISGGYDSRLILAKLHEHKYDNLHCFSYGKNNNDEAKIAKQIADNLGMQWHMLPAHSQTARALYQSPARAEYERLVHGYYRIPSYVEFEAIHLLKESGLTQDGSFIINGQSGDFIAGDHIPAALFENDNPTKETLLNYAFHKHFSMWTPLKTPKNTKAIQDFIQELLLPNDTTLTAKENLIRQYESFEWQERQCKMVVNSAHVYDFFGYNWVMPLWHSDIMDFFVSLPFELKYGRKLFLDYFKAYNYRGVFDIPRAQVRTWQPHEYWVILAAKAVEIFKGEHGKADFYKKMAYYGHAKNQYSLFGKEMYDAHYKDIRNMISLAIYDFLENHNLDLPEPLVAR